MQTETATTTLSSGSTSRGRQLPAGCTSVCQPGGGGGWEERESLEVRRAGNRWQNHLGGIIDPVGVVCAAAVGPSERLHFFLNSGTCTSGGGGGRTSVKWRVHGFTLRVPFGAPCTSAGRGMLTVARGDRKGIVMRISSFFLFSSLFPSSLSPFIFLRDGSTYK